VVFNANEYVLNTGTFVAEAPWRSDYTYEKIYYSRCVEKDVDYLTAHDYIWRWDTDLVLVLEESPRAEPGRPPVAWTERLTRATYTGNALQLEWGFHARARTPAPALSGVG